MNYSGIIDVTEEVRGEIELVTESNRCSNDMRTCAKYDTLNIHDMCKKFLDRKAFYSNVFNHIKPPFKCPIMPGIYKLEEASLDLRAFSLFPVDGYVWITTFKFVASEKGKAKRIVMCINSETKIFKTRIRQ